MEVPLFVLAIVGLLQVSFAEKVCLTAGQTITSPSDPTFYYKCIAPGVSVQLRCPSGERFAEVADKCVGISDPLAGKQLPTAPTPSLTAPTQKPIKSDGSAVEAPNKSDGAGSEGVPSKAPVSPKENSGESKVGPAPIKPSPIVKKGQKTTKRQRATTPGGKPDSKRKTSAAPKRNKTVAPKRRKVQN